MGHFAAVERFNSEIVMEHFMINNAGNDIYWDIAPIQHGMNPDNFRSIGVAC